MSLFVAVPFRPFHAQISFSLLVGIGRCLGVFVLVVALDVYVAGSVFAIVCW